MRQTLLLMAAMALVGCGKKTTPAEPEPKAEPKVIKNKPEPKAAGPNKSAGKPATGGVFTNSLGMKFVPLAGTKVRFCIWETRVQDYAAYAAANAGVDESWKNLRVVEPDFKQTEAHPVVMVNWNDANAFCAWLTKKEQAEGKIKAGEKYRLPTDAEWSLAVGLGEEKGFTPKAKEYGKTKEYMTSKAVYPWGTAWPPPNGAGNYRGIFKVDNFKHTAPVGSFAANKLGLYDLGGNVWEWCEDWFDPKELYKERVLRGASWLDPWGSSLRSFCRTHFKPDSRFHVSGFRCVLFSIWQSK